MRVDRICVVALLGITLTLGGCGEDGGVDPTASARTALSAGEVQALGDAVVGASSAMFETRLGGGSWDFGVGDAGELTITVEMSWPCEVGVLDVSGSATAVMDFQTGALEAISEAVMIPRDCRFTHTPVGDGVTMNGDPNVEFGGELSFGPTGESALAGTMTGAVLWEAEDGRSGRCQIELTLDWSMGWMGSTGMTKTVSGTVCGDDYQWEP